MTYEEAKETLQIYDDAVIGNDNSIIDLAIKTAIESLEKQIEIEKAQFTHICKSDRDIYPTEFSIYARFVSEDDESVTIDRFLKFGSLPVGTITISRKDFERYYKPIESEE